MPSGHYFRIVREQFEVSEIKPSDIDAAATGNLLAIASTFFIMGPRTQCRNMFHKNRAVASCVYLGALVATVAVAFTIKNGILVLCLVGVQAAALLWYSLSYSPFARQLVTRAVKNLCASGASG